jgi:hypothetical protein
MLAQPIEFDEAHIEHVVQYSNDWRDGGPFVIDHDYVGIAMRVLDARHHRLRWF